jgi:hypothetical protein
MYMMHMIYNIYSLLMDYQIPFDYPMLRHDRDRDRDRRPLPAELFSCLHGMGKAFQAELWAVPVPTRSVTNMVLWRSLHCFCVGLLVSRLTFLASCLVPMCFVLKNAITDNSATLPGECHYSRRSIHLNLSELPLQCYRHHRWTDRTIIDARQIASAKPPGKANLCPLPPHRFMVSHSPTVSTVL